MWLKLGTRGDPRVIYIIIIGLILIGLHRGYYSLYNLNNGQENLKVIGQEIKKINYFDSHVKLQARTLDKHIGGRREIIDTLYYDLPADRNDIYNKFMENVYKNSWKEENNTNSFKKNNIVMYVVFMEPSEYEDIKQMKGKVAWKVKMEIK